MAIARPPSYIDEHHYYAIADYPPPAYDEIDGTVYIEGNRHDPETASNASQIGIVFTTDSSDQATEPSVHYVPPLSQNRHASHIANGNEASAAVPPVLLSTLGVADIGADILASAGTSMPHSPSHVVLQPVTSLPEVQIDRRQSNHSQGNIDTFSDTSSASRSSTSNLHTRDTDTVDGEDNAGYDELVPIRRGAIVTDEGYSSLGRRSITQHM